MIKMVVTNIENSFAFCSMNELMEKLPDMEGSHLESVVVEAFCHQGTSVVILYPMPGPLDPLYGYFEDVMRERMIG